MQRKERAILSRGRHLAVEPLEGRRMLANTVGTIVNTGGAYDGYTLFAPQFSTTAYLVNLDGVEVNRWEHETPNSAAYLQPNGDLLRVGRLPSNANTLNAPGAAGRVELRDWDGNLKWSYELNTPDLRLHHDIEMMPNGNILMIAWERYTRGEALAQGRNPNLRVDNDGEVWPDVILEIEPDYDSGEGGEIVWKWSIWDHLIQDYDPTKPNYGDVGAHPELVDLNFVPTGIGAGAVAADWTHFNSIDYNPELDQIVVSAREFSEFWVIDHSTTTAEAASDSGGRYGMGGNILYRWGNPRTYDQGGRNDQQFQYQHDAQWIEPGLPGEGNFLVFNNGWNRPGGGNFSSVEELVQPERGQRWLLNNRTDGSISDLILFDTQDLQPGWEPIVGDWDGDGVDTSGFFDPATATFYLNDSQNGWDQALVTSFMTGVATPGLIPLSGDWNGDGSDSPGIYNPSDQSFLVSDSTTGWSPTPAFTATGVTTGWLPITGDWDGDGDDGVGLYDPQSNDWLLADGDAAWTDINFLPAPSPLPADWLPIAGDWNGNGRDGVGVYDPEANVWFLNNRIDGSATDLIILNAPDVPAIYQPLAGNWNGDSRDTVGLYDPMYYAVEDTGEHGPAGPVWEYVGTPRSSFYSNIVSGAQRLPNGNTLINEGNKGELFEVDANGEVVWRYVNPVIRGDRVLAQGQPVPDDISAIPGVRANLTFRAYRYALDYLDSSLDVTPVGFIQTGESAEPRLDPIADQATIPGGSVGPIEIGVFDPDTLIAQLSITATAESDLYRLDQQLRLQDPQAPAQFGQYYENFRGAGEKYLLNPAGVHPTNRWYYLLPNGELYRFTGTVLSSEPSSLTGDLVADLSEAVYDDPSLLHAAISRPTDLTFDITPGDAPTITVDASSMAVGPYTVTVEASDGDGADTTEFTLFVDAPVTAAPTLSAIERVVVSQGSSSATTPIGVSDADTPTDQLTFTASAESLLYRLDQELGLTDPQAPARFADYYQNYRGSNEKYLLNPSGVHPANRWYYVLPNGDFYRFTGDVRSSAPASLQGELLANVGLDAYSNPARLHEALSRPNDVVVTTTEGSSPSFTVSAVTSLPGPYVGVLSVSDGSKSDTVEFPITVLERPSGGVIVTTEVILPIGFSRGLAGDFSDDAYVNDEDYVRWSQAYATSDPDTDANGDGVVDAADYTVWRDNRGTVSPFITPIAVSAAVSAASAPSARDGQEVLVALPTADALTGSASMSPVERRAANATASAAAGYSADEALMLLYAESAAELGVADEYADAFAPEEEADEDSIEDPEQEVWRFV